jgi:diguanylate cyclase (GGDEF)-like protein
MTALSALEPQGAPTGDFARVKPIKPVTWRAFLALVAVAAVGASFWGSDQQLPLLGVGALAVIALAVGVRSYRLEHPLLWHVGRTKPWVLLGAGLAGVILVNAGRAAATSTAGSSAVALLAVPAYTLMAVGTVALINGRAPGRTADALLTSAIITISVAFPVWTLAFQPALGDHIELPTALAAFGLPVLDAFVLALLARLMLLSEDHPPVYSYLVLGLGTLLAVHCVAAIGMLVGVADPYTTLSGPLVLAYGLWALAALHPSMGGLFEPVRRTAPRLSRAQLAALTGALLIGPALLAIETLAHSQSGDLGIVIGSATLTALVVARMARFVQAREEVEQAASHDELTSLPRRELFNERVAISVAAAFQRGGKMAVMFIDVDRFKKINDSLGHAVGDEVIELVGRRLHHCVRGTDMVARMGGDEFTILLEDITDENDAAVVAEKVINAFVEPLNVAGRNLFVTASVGVAAYPRDGSDADTLLKNADAAMYLAKEKGRNNFQVYTAELNAKAGEWLDLENALHAAITDGQLVVYYQPKVQISTEKVVGVEALVRWNHPTLGLLGPDKFIPVAEESGLIAPLGEWVLETACAQAKAWRDEGYERLSVAVNLSARQFQLQHMDDVIAGVLRRTGLPPSLLELELTESLALQGNESIRETLDAISAFGVKCAVDDFGVGFSNFGYLGTLPIDKVKVDKSFVSQIGVGDDGAASALTIGIIALAKALGLDVVAEGVENHEQLEFLREHGCDQIQGYLFSGPLPSDQLSTLLMLEMVSPGTGRLGPAAPPQARRPTAKATEAITRSSRPLRAPARRERPLRAQTRVLSRQD